MTDDFADTFSPVVSAPAVAITRTKISGAVAIEDFVGFPPNNTFIYLPCREPWTAAAIDAVFPPQQDIDSNGQPRRHLGKAVMIKASTWLMRHRRCEQQSWQPGEPMFICDRLVVSGVGWVPRPGANVLNTYKAPTLVLGDPKKAKRWVDHWHAIYPDNADYAIKWLACRVQRPGVKINHALLLGSEKQGVGKDTLLAGATYAVGAGNYMSISPRRLLSQYSNFVRCVLLHVSEAKDTAGDSGERVDRFVMYDRMKDLIAAPPPTLHYVDKYQKGYEVINCVGVVITTNDELGSVHLPEGDRRLYVAWSTVDGKAVFSEQYWKEFWHWYEEEGGFGHVAAYLTELDISDFNPKAPPPETPAFRRMIRAEQPVEEDELADTIDALERPDALTIAELVTRNVDLEWMIAPKTRRSVPHRLGRCGYVSCESEQNQGRWLIKGRRHTVYVKRGLSQGAQHAAAVALVRKLEAVTGGGG
jgi:Family of unknown function (DUF5906)